MTAQQLTDTGTALALRPTGFSSASWLSYFQGNKGAKAITNFPETITLPSDLSTALVHSLQRFQLGESGEGVYLKKYAQAAADPTYERCIELFIKEEQGHAGVLERVIKALGGAPITWHWTALAFISLRRVLGLKTEVFMLVIAEIIGKCFYKTCADHLEERVLKDTFSLMVIDQIFHLEFHCSFMSKQMLNYAPALRQIVYYGWSLLFYVSALVFMADHRASLKALNVKPADFLHECAGTFRMAANKTLLK